jgi:hypothetical protein
VGRFRLAKKEPWLEAALGQQRELSLAQQLARQALARRLVEQQALQEARSLGINYKVRSRERPINNANLSNNNAKFNDNDVNCTNTNNVTSSCDRVSLPFSHCVYDFKAKHTGLAHDLPEPLLLNPSTLLRVNYA